MIFMMKLSKWAQKYNLSTSVYLESVRKNVDVWAAKNWRPFWPKKINFWLLMLRQLSSVFRYQKNFFIEIFIVIFFSNLFLFLLRVVFYFGIKFLYWLVPSMFVSFHKKFWLRPQTSSWLSFLMFSRLSLHV